MKTVILSLTIVLTTLLVSPAFSQFVSNYEGKSKYVHIVIPDRGIQNMETTLQAKGIKNTTPECGYYSELQNCYNSESEFIYKKADPGFVNIATIQKENNFMFKNKLNR